MQSNNDKKEKKKKGQTQNSQNKKTNNKKKSAPKTLAETIPYEKIYSNGIIEMEPGLFSRSYHLPDVNFRTVSDSRQQQIGEQWAEFLNTFDPDVNVEVTFYNNTIDINKFQERVFLKMRPDELNIYRDEYNEMLLDKMTGAKNNIETLKILTVSFHSKNIGEAVERLVQIDSIVSEHMELITKMNAKPFTTTERLNLLYAIYHQDTTVPLCRKKKIQGREVESFSLENCIKQGITTKEVIAPSGFTVNPNYINVGDSVSRSYYVANWPSWIKGTLLSGFTSIPANMLISIHFNSMDQGEAAKMLKRQRTNISSILLDRQKRSSREGYSAELLSPDAAEAKEETEGLMEGISKDNSKLFLTFLTITLFASDLEQLASYEEKLKTIANMNLIMLKPLEKFQEKGFNSSLPLANNKIKIQRLMTSDTVMSLLPFDVKEVRQENGMYYGLNASSHNMVLYNRLSDINPNGCILGMPGGGKSFAAKREMLNIILNTDDEVYVIDPENEYWPMAKLLGGSVIRIANGAKSYINPFDMNLENTNEDNDPVKVKSDFITIICEISLGGRFGLSPRQTSIIDRCVQIVYEPYLKYLTKTGKTIDYEKAPTLLDFYNVLLMQPQPDAQDLALALERYVKGGLDIFSHNTNVDINNRFTVFDIKDIGSGLKEMGLQICLDNIFNKMIENKAKGKRTWFYIDEFYLMMQKESSAEYIAEIWKRARKWDGVPTAITQNVEDMLKSEQARTIINNCSFVMLLRQAPINKAQVSSLFNISYEEQKYISANKPGTGLLWINNDIIPIDDSFPTDTTLYKIMTTKPNETLNRDF